MKTISLLATAAVVLLILAILVIPTKEERAIKEATELFAIEDYEAALEVLAKYEGVDAQKLRKNIYQSVEEMILSPTNRGNHSEAQNVLDSYPEMPDYDSLQIQIAKNLISSLVEDGDYAGALNALNAASYMPESDAQRLRNEIYSSVESTIILLMDRGEYVKAGKTLRMYPGIPRYNDLNSQIMSETFILHCAFQIRSAMKNPSSMQITDVQILYRADDSEYVYPYVILDHSAQNGFGGYSTSHSLYDNEDLEISGYCSTLDYDDLDPEDDEIEYYTALMIDLLDLTADPVPHVKYDLARINSFLSSGNKPDLDITYYKNNYTGESLGA